jgi:hypothetical protein
LRGRVGLHAIPIMVFAVLCCVASRRFCARIVRRFCSGRLLISACFGRLLRAWNECKQI